MRLDIANPFPQLVWIFVEFLNVYFVFPLDLFWWNVIKFMQHGRPFEIFLDE
jgi:hypothetical protein